MSELKVLVWNVNDGLSDPKRAPLIVEKVANINPDIAIFPEGARGDQTPTLRDTWDLAAVGAQHMRPYDDIDGRVDQHLLVAVARPEFNTPDISKPLGRSAMVFWDANGFVVAGMHGFDRHGWWPDDPEEARKRQIRALLGHKALKDEGPAIIMGDLSAMHGDDRIAKRLRFFSPLANLLPSKNPGMDRARVERLGSAARQLCSMATGDVLLDTGRAGFYDADASHQPTTARPFRIQSEYILVRGAGVKNFEVHPYDDLSNHYAISATVVSQ